MTSNPVNKTLNTMQQTFDVPIKSLTVATSMSVTTLNKLLQNDWLKVLLLLIGSVFAGYTLYPVPAKLDDMFTNSVLFKYMILFAVLISALHHLDNRKIILALLIPIVVLGIFNLLR